jgi:hypothetical protein
MCVWNRARVFFFVFAVGLSLAVSQAPAQTYVFGTAGYPAPVLAKTSPPQGNPPVITADFNGDGIPDLAVLGADSSGTQELSIYLGKPDGTFAPKVDYPVSATGFTVGDFNGDGKLDIIVISYDSLDVASILLGNGDGTFQNPVALDLGIGNGQYSEVVSADFNGDGKLDLAVLTPDFGFGATLAILLGNGDGTFGTPATYALPTAPYIAVGDFNGDGKPDIAVSGPNYGGANVVAVLINHGDGTFLSPVTYGVAGTVEALAAGDLNGDGKLDLVVATGGQTAGLSVLLGIGDGTFASPLVYASNLLSIYSSSIAIADFNGDGKLDLALAPSAGPNGYVAILQGNGDGTFQNPPLLYSAGLLPAEVVALDANGDGRPDLAVWGGYGVGAYFSVTVLLNQGFGRFPGALAYPVVQYPWTAAVGDFNGDGKPDIAVASVTTNSGGQDTGGVVSVLLNNGDGTFPPRVDTATSTFPLVIAPGDFNGDGKLDLLVVEGTQTNELLSTWLGNGDGTFQNNISQVLPAFARSLAVGDFNHDGKLDVAATVGSGGVSVFLGLGNGAFAAPVVYPAGPPTAPLANNVIAADFNGDGNLDLAATAIQGISVLLGKGDGTFLPYSVALPTSVTLPELFLLAVGDFNGDGKPDLVITPGNGTIGVALGNGDGTFQQPTGFFGTSILGLSSPIVGDFNGDGKLDIAFSSQSASVVTILFGNGDGTFSRHVEYATDQVPSLVAADFNGDGALDLAMTDVTYQTVAVFLNSPVSALWPSRLVFGNQLAGTSSSEQTVTLSNPGAARLAISSIAASGDFTATNDCGSSLAVGASCQVSVTFAPTAEGDRKGILTFTTNASPVPQMLSLEGTGEAPGVSLSPSSLTFAAQVVGTTGASQSVELTNTGDEPLTITSIGVSGDFSQRNSCGSAVAAGANCALSVTFTPTAGGARNGTLTVVDNAPGSPHTVGLAGTGQDFSIGIASGSSATATVTPGQTATYSLSLSALGGLNQTISLTCAGAPSEATCTVNPSTFTPSGAGPENVTVTVTTTAPSHALPVERPSPPFALLGSVIVALVLLLAVALASARHPLTTRRNKVLLALVGAAVVALAIVMAACGRGGEHNPGTPAGSYSITLTGTLSGSSPLTHTITLTLVVS